MTYEEKKFDLPELKGLSTKQVDIHLGLYGGYVKHVNLLRDKLRAMEAEDSEKHAYSLAETRRRFAFEFNGMRMHEYYFGGFEKGTQPASTSSKLALAVSEKYGSWGKFTDHIKMVALGTRGIGWVVVAWDTDGKVPHTVWVSDHELGQLAGLPVILALDMWEHAYMVDYTPAEKKQYVDSYFNNLNWKIIEERFDKVQ